MNVSKFLIVLSCVGVIGAAQAKQPEAKHAHANGKGVVAIAAGGNDLPRSSRAVVQARGPRGGNGQCPASAVGAPPFGLPPGRPFGVPPGPPCGVPPGPPGGMPPGHGGPIGWVPVGVPN